MIVDTSALLAYFDRSEPDHTAVSTVINELTDPLVVSPYIIAELDYLVATRIGVEAELAVLRELAGGAWELPEFGMLELRLATAIVENYRDQAVGVADASNVVLADRYHTHKILTLDHRHFKVLHPLDGGAFTVVP